MGLLGLILLGVSMRDIVVKITDNTELEAVMPIDRVVTVDDNNLVYLADIAYIIEEDMIEREL